MFKGGFKMTKEDEKKKKTDKLAKRDPTPWWPWDLTRSMDEEFDEMRRSIERSLFWPHSRIGSGIRAWPEYFRSGLESGSARMAIMDIKDTGEELLIEAEMPGIPKENIDIQLTENSIEICGEIREEVKKDQEGYIRQERSYTTCQRQMPLPAEIVPDKADATLADGILHIKLPKKKPTPKEKTHTLKVK
jgi:HSP20 family protein